MIAARRSPAASTHRCRSSTSTLPSSSHFDDHHVHPGHHRARGVRAVGARRDQADRPLVVAAAVVVGADREQPGELALAAGVGLEAHGVVAGDLGEHRFEVGDQARR
jgi:hypothetical protein